MNNNYNPTTQENEIERMKQLMGYGLNESKSHDNGNSNVAYHQVGPDGNTYGIIKECNKFYIKVAPKKDTEILAEDYDYIGGYMNKKQYEYPTYTIASKQFGLKMKSLNEAYATKEKKNKVVLDKPIEPAEWQINETKEMRQEINRFNQLMNNVDYILSEGKELEGKALQLGNKDVDEEGGNAYQEKPVSDKEVNNMKENAPAPKDSDDTYNEKPMSVDQVNKMKENSKDPKKADNTYSKNAPKTLKLTNEQAEKVLAWSQDKNYMDTTHGTEIGDSAPYDEKPEVTNESVYNSEDMNQHTGDAEEYMEPYNNTVEESVTNVLRNIFRKKNKINIDDFEGIRTWNDDGSRTSERENNEIDGFRTWGETNEEIEIDSETGLPTEDSGQMLVDDEEMLPDQSLDYETRDDMDDFEPIDNSGEDMLPDEVLDYETRDDMDYVLESVVKKVLKKHLVKENKLDVFGKHPAYQKQPMTLPSNFEPSKFGKEWDDDSVKGDKPYGTEIGHGGDPYTERVIDMLTDSVVDKLVTSMTGEAGKKKA